MALLLNLIQANVLCFSDRFYFIFRKLKGRFLTICQSLLLSNSVVAKKNKPESKSTLLLNLIKANSFGFANTHKHYFIFWKQTDLLFFATKLLLFLRIKRCNFLKLFANSLSFSTIFRCVLQIIFCYAKTFFSTVAPENLFVQTCFSRHIQHLFCKKYPALCFGAGLFSVFSNFYSFSNLSRSSTFIPQQRWRFTNFLS